MSSYGIGWLTVVNSVRSSDSPFRCLLLYMHIPIQALEWIDWIICKKPNIKSDSVSHYRRIHPCHQ